MAPPRSTNTTISGAEPGADETGLTGVEPVTPPPPPLTWPSPPQSLDAIGVTTTALIDLFLRRLFIDKRSSIVEMGRRLGLSYPIVEALIAEVRTREWVEIHGASGRDLQFSLTDAGRGAARVVSARCSWAGAAPVSLDEYRSLVRAQTPHISVGQDSMRQALGDLVIPDTTIDQLGPGLLAEGAMFLYGPPGTGKSSIAERLIRCFDDAIAVPHALSIDNQIVKIYDPVVHEALADQPEWVDQRYMLCHRPCLLSGGELTERMLDLRYDQSSGIHIAPLQLQANNGVFVIDDLGRQLISPAELLNRWIVPLERQIDFLQLNSGIKFAVPFAAKVVFSTNLDPNELGDEAFFRRIAAKIRIGELSEEEFTWVLQRVSGAMGLPLDEDAPAALVRLCREFTTGELRAFLPRDFCRLIVSICAYNRWQAQVTPYTLERAAEIYWPR